MKIIDFHTHIYPDKISKKAVKNVGDFYNIKMKCDGTAECLISERKASGITHHVVCSVATTGAQVEKINDYIISETEKNSSFIGLLAMHADYPNKIDELIRAMSKGLVGVKIHPDTQHFNMDDKRMYEFYDYLSQKKIPILVHCGDYRYTFSHPKRVKKVLKDFPDLVLIAAHFGGWSMFDLAFEYLKNTKCYFDTSSSFSFLGLRRAEELIRMYGAERMLFGSDFPMWKPYDELKLFNKLKLTNEEKELILYKNAEKILGKENLV